MSLTAHPITAADLPRFGRTPYQQGAKAAIEALTIAYGTDTIRGDHERFNEMVQKVTDGPAPQEFKDGFEQTLRGLIQTLTV